MEAQQEFMYTHRPVFKYLSDEQKMGIHQASLEILEHTGADFYSQEAIDLLVEAGARQIDEKRLKIPSFLVEEAIRNCPKQIVMANRKGERVMPLVRMKTYYGPGSETPYTLDVYSGERRPTLKTDVVNAAKVVDYLPHMDFLMSFALAQDVPKRCEDVHHFEAMVLNCTKPILFTSWDLDGIKAIYEICVAVAGSEENFRENPFILHYVEPISPLKNPKESLDKLLFSAEHGIPVMYVPAPSAGGTAPITMAGAFALSNAENLMGLVMTQLKRKGAPFIYGGGPGTLDPQTGCFPYGAPEMFLSRVVRAEMGQYYGLPSFSTGGCTDAKTLDQQAAFEAGNSLLLSTLAGATFIHDIGYIESGFTSSLELLGLANEMIGHIKRIHRGISVSPEHLALDLIHQKGPEGNFLATKHTVKHLRSEIFISEFFDRQNYHGWEATGKKTMKDRMNEKIRWILENHEPEALSEDVIAKVKNIVADLDRMRQKNIK